MRAEKLAFDDIAGFRMNERSWPCATCNATLTDRSAYTAWWPERNRRAHFCKECLGELHFNILPDVTGPGPSTPMGAPGGAEEPSPWQENARRILEGD